MNLDADIKYYVELRSNPDMFHLSPFLLTLYCFVADSHYIKGMGSLSFFRFYFGMLNNFTAKFG
jgi:hypothetical protein